MSKEKEVILNILELYKDMPYLWDKNDKNFMNKNVRNEGFQVLLSLYKNIDESATVKTLKKKIDNLKTNYSKELKKVKQSKHTGAGNEDVYVPTIWYYDSLSFLESTTESCRSVRDTIENEDSSLSCSEDTQLTSSNTTFNKNLFRKKKEAPLKQQQAILEKASNLMNKKEEDWEILGRSIGMQLRDLNKSQHTIACKLISDVIFYATLNKLSEESFVGVTLTPTNNYRATSRPSYPSFTPSGSSSSQSEFHPPVHTSSSPQRIQSPSPYPLPPTHLYHNKSPDSSLHTLPFQYQTQSPHPSTSKHIQSSNSSLHSLPPPQQVQSPDYSPSTQYNRQSVNSSTVKYIVQVPHPSVSPPPSMQLHIPSPPQSSTPNQYETDDTVSIIEGNAGIMKDFLIFRNKKK